jgi:cell division protease FtsH
MARAPEDDPGGSEESRSSGRPIGGPGILLVVLLLLGLMFSIALLKNFESPEIRYDMLVTEYEKGNILEFEFAEPASFGRLREPPAKPAVAENKTKPETSPEGKSEGKTLADITKSPDSEPEDDWKFIRNRKNLDFSVLLPPGMNTRDSPLALELVKKGAKVSNRRQVDPIMWYLMIAILVPVLMATFMWLSIRRSQNQMFGGGGFLSGFAKSPAKRYEASKQSTTFKDVAGLEGVKTDLLEIVEFLKDPTKFQKLGGRVPKGVLLNGPPGTGKTLLARAIAGEAGVPFFSVNGSEFIQMFVGVGASRVRDLFRNAKDASPAIIFIDEIDAVGRQRGAGLGGGHDEREQTLNQILSEMDGFDQTDFVIVIAATNRPDVLDPALLRPGRFDRHVQVDRPTQKGRAELFRVHTREVPLAADVDLERLASATIGLTGADIRNMVNEAALWAARYNKTAVSMDDFEFARDKILMGAKREEILTEQEKERTAYHEAGHAILGWKFYGSHKVHKVTIVPRGRALGVTHFVPTEERMDITETELRDRLIMMLGGRAAEKVVFDQTTAGAENDLERATYLARRMVTSWGMSSRLGPVSYKLGEEDPFLGREMSRPRVFSEHTMELIDEEVARILHEASDAALSYLSAHREELENLTRELIRQEELDTKEIEAILGPPVEAKRNGPKPI